MATQDIFTNFQDYLNADHELREEIRNVVKELEQTAREIQMVLQVVHQPSQLPNVSDVCTKADSMYEAVRSKYQELSAKVPENQYYRFNDHWRFVTQRCVYMAALIHYLGTGELIGRAEVTEKLGVKSRREDGFHLDLDDYLMGILSMTNELSRLAMNAVTSGDYSLPVRISQFVTQLDSGFRLLNLKNDSLRKRFDGLKYDVKRCEEVVYDLTIRGLINQPIEKKE